MTIVAMAVEDPTKPGLLYTPSTGKKLVAVDCILVNNVTEPRDVSGFNWTLVDSEGGTHEQSLDSREGGYPTSGAVIGQNEKIRVWLTFDIATSARPASIKYEVAPGQTVEAGLGQPAQNPSVPELPKPSFDNLAKLGTAAESYGISLTANQVEDPFEPPAGSSVSEPGNKLVAVEMTLTNVSSDESLNTNQFATELLVSDGYAYGATLIPHGQDATLSGDLAKGASTKGWAVYEVPAGAVPAAVRLSIGLFRVNFVQVGLQK